MSELGPYEEMMMKRHIEDDSIFQQLYCWPVFAKINFDEVVAMSDITGCLGTAYLRQNGAKISLGDGDGDVVQGCDIATTLVGSPLYHILAMNTSESDSN